MELIPGLPNDMGRQCLHLISFENLSVAVKVCKSWKREIENPMFFYHRKVAGFTQLIMVIGADSYISRDLAPPPRCFTLWEPKTRNWTNLPFPGLGRFSLRSNLVQVRSDLIYNFLSGTWRRGADMPGCERDCWHCVSDSTRMVYVLGGFNLDFPDEFIPAMAYDVPKNVWVQLPSLLKNPADSIALFHRGKLRVTSKHDLCETLNMDTRQWEHEEINFELSMDTRTCVSSEDGHLYICAGEYVARQVNAKWQAIAQMPKVLRCRVQYITTVLNKMILIDWVSRESTQNAYVLDLQLYTWTKLEMEQEHSVSPNMLLFTDMMIQV